MKGIFGLLCLVLFLGCKTKRFSAIEELRKTANNKYILVRHQTGVFLIGIEPLSYLKTKKDISLTGIFTYTGKTKYSLNYDSLLNGMGRVEVFYAEKIKKDSTLTILSELSKSDCNGFFRLKSKRKSNSYLILISDGCTPTAVNAKYYFDSFKEKYDSKFVTKMKKCD